MTNIRYVSSYEDVSKSLKNEIAGYITNFIKKQISLKEESVSSETKDENAVSDESD